VRQAVENYAITNDDEEAERRASDWRDLDPFGDNIPKALLSKEHIRDYVRVTGMLCPFFPDEDGRLKAASYEAWPSRFIRWNEAGQKLIDNVDIEDYKINGYELKENSITFMQIESKIRLPNYIALRFNLSITHVHRGLLLGTGPLVDPGFSGNLLIPLHNLTSAPYRIKRGVIWIEFTKTSAESTPPVDFERRKRDVNFETYFERASGNNPIQSSIPLAVKDAQKSASEAKADARRAVRTNFFFASVGFLALLGMIIAAANFGISVLRDATQVRQDTGQNMAEIRRLNSEAEATRAALDSTERQLQDLRQQMDKLRPP
jgi:deoxycytidine triphosphate deaminase